MTFEDTETRQRDPQGFSKFMEMFTKNLDDVECCRCGKVFKGVVDTDGKALCVDCEAHNRELIAKFNREDSYKSRLNSFPPKFRGVKPEDAPAFRSGILWGNFGTGKTWAMYGAALEFPGSWEIKTEFSLIQDIRFGESNRLEYYKRVGFLGVDEFGKINETGLSRAAIFEILNYRYEWEMETLIIVNAKTKDEVREIIPADILDRYRANVLEFKGRSRR